MGRRWQDGEWTISDEHAATSIAEQALAVLRQTRRHRNPAARRVVLACPEGEWHTFPARLAADLAGTTGIDVIVAGGSQPAEHLGVFLRQAQPDALALSVTTAVNLVGAWKAIQAAHMLGVPVVAGGAAWGPGSERSERLGADLRVEDPAGLVRAVNLLAAGRPLRPPVSLAPEVEHLSSWDDRHGRSSEVETSLVRAAAAAVACDDTSILDDMRRSLGRASASGGVSDHVVRSVCQRLSQRLAEDAPLAAALLSDQAAQ